MLPETHSNWSGATFPLVYRIFKISYSCHVTIQPSSQNMVADMTKNLQKGNDFLTQYFFFHQGQDSNTELFLFLKRTVKRWGLWGLKTCPRQGPITPSYTQRLRTKTYIGIIAIKLWWQWPSSLITKEVANGIKFFSFISSFFLQRSWNKLVAWVYLLKTRKFTSKQKFVYFRSICNSNYGPATC